ncbi:hypothetical protein NKH77_33285 [Streptomyces sp. M19]
MGSYDLETGKQDWCVDLTALTLDGKQHLISDVTVAPDGTAYAVDELSPTVFRIDTEGHASVFLRNDLLQGELDIPDFLNDVGMAAVDWVDGNQLIIAMADGSLVRVPVQHPDKAEKVKLSAPLGSPRRACASWRTARSWRSAAACCPASPPWSSTSSPATAGRRPR